MPSTAEPSNPVAWAPEPLSSADAAEVAVIIRRSREQAMPWLPDLYTPDEDRVFFAGELARSRGWGVRGDGTLLGVARSEAVEPLRLWVFAWNVRAQEFYARAGFEVERATDGSGNEEREPDLLLRDRPR